MTLEDMRRDFVTRFLDPMFEQWVAEAKQSGAISDAPKSWTWFWPDTPTARRLMESTADHGEDRIARQGPSPLADGADVFAEFMKVSDALMAKQMMSFYVVPFDKTDPKAEVECLIIGKEPSADEPIIATDPHGPMEPPRHDDNEASYF